jgi:phosphatidylglycerol:prolipoprotein diacylglycerol transferase
MINGITLPGEYVALVLIPLACIFISLLIRSFLEEKNKAGESRMKDQKKEFVKNLIWILPALAIGGLLWWLLLPLYKGQDFKIYFYGILITLGVVAAAFLSQLEAKRRGFDPDYIWDALFWVVLAGIIGARLWHVFTPPPSMVAQGITTKWYLLHPFEILNVRNGGLGIPGAVIGGAIALAIYCRQRKLSFRSFVDIVVPGLALAQAIGRWGNFFNQEVYGRPTSLPWKIFIDPAHRIPGFENVEYYHPLFLYESLWNLINMAVLLWLGRRYQKWLKTGDLFLIYMIMYSIGRFSLEFLRLDSSLVAGINFNQTFVAVVAVVAGMLLLLNHRLRRA